MAYFLNREKDYPVSLTNMEQTGWRPHTRAKRHQASHVCRSQFPKTRSPSVNNRNLQLTRMCLFLFLALEKEAVLMKTSYDEGFSERHKSIPFRLCLEA